MQWRGNGKTKKKIDRWIREDDISCIVRLGPMLAAFDVFLSVFH